MCWSLASSSPRRARSNFVGVGHGRRPCLPPRPDGGRFMSRRWGRADDTRRGARLRCRHVNGQGRLALARERRTDADGVPSVPHPAATHRWVEQDPRDWIAAMAACWSELQATAGDVELRSVGLCSQANTHLFVDADLEPLRPAITWQDVRAAEASAELGKDASFSLSRLAWLERHEPEVRAATRWLLLPKDYCLAELTGEIATDPLSAVGLVGDDGRYLEDVLGLVDGAAELLPPLREHDQPAWSHAAGQRRGPAEWRARGRRQHGCVGQFLRRRPDARGSGPRPGGHLGGRGRGLGKRDCGAWGRVVPSGRRDARPCRTHAGWRFSARVGRAAGRPVRAGGAEPGPGSSWRSAAAGVPAASGR